MASIACPVRRPQMATVRPGILKVRGCAEKVKGQVELQAGLGGVESGVDGRCLHSGDDGDGCLDGPDSPGGLDNSDSGFASCSRRIVKVDVNISKPRVRLIERVSEACENNLADAEIIVAGGRGVGSAEDFALIRELACALGGAVGATRPVVDAGWAPESSLIGQTGRIVSPRLYIACGISGAIQHMVGISADVIVAINKDVGAPIFRSATYGIVGDVAEVIPALLDEVKNS
ncbi:MAG: electron transfer flavoprotein subunit alpha/FixB family protein [Firmicutes bacterium]|nr:electron transfer flavoprotein subunit alpha/FixB family protein [Bacillota bacterium]